MSPVRNTSHKISRAFCALLLSVILLTVAQPALVTAFARLSKPQTTDQSTLVVKLKPGTDINLQDDTFIGEGTTSATELNTTLHRHKAGKKRMLLSDNKATIRQNLQHARSRAKTTKPALDNYYTIRLGEGERADDVAKQLTELDVVETAYAKPLPAPTPSTPNYANLQTYLNAAPTGMDVNARVGTTANKYPGSLGAQVQVADLEYSWNANHEDLSRLRQTDSIWAYNTPVDPFDDTDHGTGVAGVVAGDRNGTGIDGIVPSAQYHMVNTYSAETGWSVSDAIYLAANKMSAGDVILIEQQAWAPDGNGYAPMEIYQDVYEAIVYATSLGINVVEPAGNGRNTTGQGYNLDDAMFGGAFTTARPNSGAILVGAGGNGCGMPTRARMPFSNYGSRVDVQGIGECVTTTGYGDLYGSSTNMLYTSSFNGTSSASATIAGLVAELASSYEKVNGAALAPATLKSILATNSTVQATTSSPGNIGGRPNMAAALKAVDITTPNTPSKLTGKRAAKNKISLNWNAATDNLGYVQYQVYRNNTKLATTSSLKYTDSSLKKAGTYTYKVRAVDASGNLSAFSNKISVKN